MALGARRHHSASWNAAHHETPRKLSTRILLTSEMTYENWPVTNDISICHWSLANSHMSFAEPRLSPPQQVTSIHVKRFAIAEHRNHQSQADRGFRRGDHEHEEHEDLAADLPMLIREDDESQVHGVQHNLD